MAPKLLERLLAADRPTLLKLATVLNDSLVTKDALVWFRDEQRQTTAQELDWTGQLKPASGDYLAVVHSNIAGQKTDLVMEDGIDHSVQVMAPNRPFGTGHGRRFSDRYPDLGTETYRTERRAVQRGPQRGLRARLRAAWQPPD
jgi:hypothetical protein